MDRPCVRNVFRNVIPIMFFTLVLHNAIQKTSMKTRSNLRIFLEYFEAKNADLLRILRLCYVILIKKVSSVAITKFYSYVSDS